MLFRSIFQFTPPRRGRPVVTLELEPVSISIHAPAQGATQTGQTRGLRALFQFTPPRRGRLKRRIITIPPKNFNSRPRAGGDRHHRVRVYLASQFQFTPPRRGRLVGLAFEFITYLFQFTPPRRGRLAENARLQNSLISIHAPAQGATCYIPKIPKHIHNFNSRPRAGGDSKTAQRRLAVFVQKSKKLKANLVLRLLQDAKTTENYTNSTNCTPGSLAAFCADLPGFSAPQRSAQRSQQ